MRWGFIFKRVVFFVKRRRLVFLVLKIDCIREDDGGVEDFFMIEDVDLNVKLLKEYYISFEEDSYELEFVCKESIVV